MYTDNMNRQKVVSDKQAETASKIASAGEGREVNEDPDDW